MELTLVTPVNYEIKVQGWLDETWSDWMSGMQIKVYIPEGKKPVAILNGRLKDQSELLGVLNNLYELHLPILSVSVVSQNNSGF
ncbi:MAG: hypothetical protein QNK19_07770 [Xanthomonadales bacterium]|nr:hypothetical protein [Xanthomonadales bacterium]